MTRRQAVARAGRRTGPVLAVLWQLSLVGLGRAAPAAEVADRPAFAARIRHDPPGKSHSRRFLALGGDPVLELQALRWAEDLAERVERILGQPGPFADRQICLVLCQPTNAAPARTATSTTFAAGSLIQRCVLYSPAALDRATADEALVRLLLDGYILRAAAADTRGPPPEGWPKPRRWTPAPVWLSAGLVQLLYPERRARNRELALSLWPQGLFPTPFRLLRHGARPPAEGGAEDASPDGLTNAADRAACGLFVGWLLSLPDDARWFQQVIARLAGGETVTAEWLLTALPQCRSAAELDEQWDRWILRQRHVVHAPGVVTAAALQQLKAELLLYPGVSGIPKSVHGGEPLTLRELIAERRAPWVPPAAREKAARLQLLAIGRGPEFAGVMDGYLRFLEALAAGRRRGRLERLLNRAEESLGALEATRMENGLGLGTAEPTR